MAAKALIPEDEISCSVCCDIFKDPVLLKCSHSFCRECLKQYWEKKSSRECPICMRKASMDNPPANLALRNIVESYLQQRTKSETAVKSEDHCCLHGEKLVFFCEQDKELLCLICQTSKKHRNHPLCPVEEAAQDLKEELKPSLNLIKDKLKRFTEVQQECQKIAEHIRSQIQSTERQIKGEFEKLHQFLREEEEARLAVLKEEERMKSQIMEEKIEHITRDVSILTDKITAIEKSMETEDTSFLKSYKSIRERAQCSLQDPELLSGALIDVAKHLGNLQFRVWEKMLEMVQYKPSAPGRVEATDVKSKSVTLCWERPVSMEGVPHEIHITYSCEGEEPRLQKCAPNTTTAVLTDLRPVMEYTFNITTVLPNGSCSETSSVCARTQPSAPGRVEATDVKSSSVTLCWERPVSMEGVPHEIHITYSCEGGEPRLQKCAPNTTIAVLSDLRPVMEYTFNITTVLPNGSCSETSSVCVRTLPELSLDELLSDLGLEHHLRNKLTLCRVLEIDGEILTDENIQSLKSLPSCFLRKLMMVNVTARSVSCTSQEDRSAQTLDTLLDELYNPEDHSNTLNSLDLITAVLLCSDSFLQQEILLKMSLCQFSVPLLLPNCDTQQCTLMLWAMRDIVKKSTKAALLGGPERVCGGENCSLSSPMISFVRLGNCSMSKSHILNQVLSNSQQYHDTFVHKYMESGDIPRKISNGLVEISWYLPSGNKNIDIFSEPLAIANLRGDIRDFETQYAFLCRTSAAIFLFCEDLGSVCKYMDIHQLQTHQFLISNSQSKTFNENDLRRCVSELKSKPTEIIIKTPQINEGKFIRKLCLAISDILKRDVVKMSVEDMSAPAHELGIHSDEESICCQRGRKMADEITRRISDIPSFKEKELPLQGPAWKQLAKLEKEEYRLKYAGDKNLEVYRNDLADQKQELRAQQRAHSMSEPMSLFIKAMSASTEERKYFLKWMRINLDNLSRKTLSLLWAEYKQLCQKSAEYKRLIAELDRKINSCSLGTEHFLREMAQLYESACSDPKGPSPEIKLLPRLCAQLLQEGFPLELLDGDASNIPLQWVTQVLKELDHLTQYKCKIWVITVLGVQSTGNPLS
ncbi:hypothetical protein GJAV_G00275520 [Gymnothorax javanicus]|nr:hypothetical protein GJAV_G00275520 [Gymnothorax javanicus]